MIPELLETFRIDAASARLSTCPQGFSGAKVWRVDSPLGAFALRRWPPEHPSPARLDWIHRVLRRLPGAGFALAPLPRATRTGTTFLESQGCLWELATWMPGAGDYRSRPSHERLRAACHAVARFHLAARPLIDREFRPMPSPGILERKRFLHDLLSGGAARLRAAITPGDWPEAAERGLALLDRFSLAAKHVEQRLLTAAEIAAPPYVSLRDIRIEHVLFEGDRVSGLIDFGAMAVESRAADIARLLGDAAEGNAAEDNAAWSIGIEESHLVEPLTPAERQLIDAFASSSALLSGMRWLTWIYLEKRTFADRQAVIERLDLLLHRLQRLAQTFGSTN